MIQIIHIVDKLNRVYNISSIPFVLFLNDSVEFYYKPDITDFYYPNSFLNNSFKLLKKTNYPFIFCVHEGVYIGLFKTNDFYLLLGPISTSIETNYIDALFKNNVANYSTLRHVFSNIMPISITKFANLLSIIFEICTQKEICPEEIIEESKLNIDTPWNDVIENILTFDNDINDICLFEVSLFNIINSGNELAIEELRKLKYPPLIGRNFNIAKTDQFALLPIFTVMSRAAIHSGANVKKVFEIYNSAIIEYQRYPSTIEFMDLIFTYAKKFCNLVKENYSPIDRPDICILIERYILWNLNENITLSDLAKYCNLSERQIQRIFSKYFHCTFKEYILNTKIRQAKTLLFSTNLSISDISITLGFVSQSYFSKRFQYVTGQTPSEYRKNKHLI